MISFILSLPIRLVMIAFALFIVPFALIVTLVGGPGLEMFAYVRSLMVQALPFLPPVGKKVSQLWHNTIAPPAEDFKSVPLRKSKPVPVKPPPPPRKRNR